MTAVNTDNIFSSFTSFGNIAFTNNPNMPTADSTDNSTKVATTDYVLATVNDPVNYTPFYRSYSSNADIILNTVKTFTGLVNTFIASNGSGILTLGDGTTTNIGFGSATTAITLLGQLLTLDTDWKYAIFGSSSAVSATSVSTSVNKIQRGAQSWTGVSNGLFFPFAFTNVPSIILTGGGKVTNANYSVQGLSATGCNVRSNSTLANTVYWMAVGN